MSPLLGNDIPANDGVVHTDKAQRPRYQPMVRTSIFSSIEHCSTNAVALNTDQRPLDAPRLCGYYSIQISAVRMTYVVTLPFQQQIRIALRPAQDSQSKTLSGLKWLSTLQTESVSTKNGKDILATRHIDEDVGSLGTQSEGLGLLEPAPITLHSIIPPVAGNRRFEFPTTYAAVVGASFPELRVRKVNTLWWLSRGLYPAVYNVAGW